MPRVQHRLHDAPALLGRIPTYRQGGVAVEDAVDRDSANGSSAPLTFSSSDISSGPSENRSTDPSAWPLNPSGRCRTGRNVSTISCVAEPTPLPDRSVNGTPVQRAVRTSNVTSASVSVCRSGSTPGSSV